MEYIIESHELATRLVSSIDAANIDSLGDKDWTKNVMCALKSILAPKGPEIIFTDREREITEFMLDFVAWDRSDGEGFVLVAESEWVGVGRDAESYSKEVVYDFYKLLVVKSAIKLMIFASNIEHQYPQDSVLKAIKESFESYRHHVEGERYVFVDFAPGGERMAFCLEVPHTKNGRAEFEWKKIELNSELA